MKSFLKMLLASILGVFVSMFLVFFIIIIIMVGMVAGLGSGTKTVYVPGNNTVLQIDLSGDISDRKATGYMSGLFGDTEKSAGIDDILRAIRTAKESSRVVGIYIRTGNLYAGLATVEPIRKALEDFQSSGKPVVAYGDYYTQGAYYVASVADRVVLNPQGMLMFHGLASYTPFFKGMYDKLGIKYQVFRVGTFKAAVEPFTETKMSDANRQQVTSYVGSVWEWMLSGITASRGIGVEDLNRYADEYMDFSAPEKAVEYRLVDTLMYAPDVIDMIKEMTGVGVGGKIRLASVNNLNAVPAETAGTTGNEIAVLYAEGQIFQGERRDFGMFSENIITDGEYVDELEKLKDNEAVKAVVFRVNSPGGSAYASEQIWRAVTELKKVKPVVVSMGDLAASGGYYISCAADMIVAEPATLTGSIGGFALIPEGADLFGRIGMTFDGVKTNRHSDMNSVGALIPARPYNEDEKAILQTYVNRFCSVFYTRCAEGRGKTVEEIDAIGQGRVWTGAQAKEIGLVDGLGSLDDAIATAANLAELADYDITSYPVQKDAFTQLMETLQDGSIKAALVRSLLGDGVYRQYMAATVKNAPVDLVQALMTDEIAE